MGIAYTLRSGPSGPQFEGSPGDLLTLQSDGRAAFQPASAAPGDHKVSVNAVDTADYLSAKVLAGAGAAVNQLNSGPGVYQLQIAAQPPPFKARLFVDPAATGIQTGSSANPFSSFAAAFAFAATAGITSGVIFLPANAQVTENVTFPATGGNWEITTQGALANYAPAGIIGTVDISTSATARRALTNLTVTGNVSGVAAGGASRCLLQNVTVSGTTTLTTTGGATWRLYATAWPPGSRTGFTNGTIASLTGAVSVAGTVFAQCITFAASLSFNGTGQFTDCAMPPAITTTAAGTVFLNSCSNFAGGAMTYTVAAGTVIAPDGATMREFMRSSVIISGTGTLACQDANQSVRQTIANNVGSTTLSARTPAGLLEICASLTLLVAGTAGSAVVNVTYTDMTGTLVTKAITTGLDITAAAGTTAQASLLIDSNGATAIQYSVTGIATPGALSLALAVAVQQRS